MDNFEESVMLALLPTNSSWCHIELPHMTLVYAGKKNNLKPSSFNELAKDASAIAMVTNPLSLKTIGVEEFGNWSEDPDARVDVLRLEPSPSLLAIRRFVEHWNASEHPFNPHCTIGPVGLYKEDWPMYLVFDRIHVGWGNEGLTFWLKR